MNDAHPSPFDLRHALAVAGRVDGLDAKVVALLHDAVEDNACTFEELQEAELPAAILSALDLLARPKGMSYEHYINVLRDSGDELAVYVKLADLDANLDRMDDEHASLTGRYRRAQRDLREGTSTA